jgi:phosphoribosylformylglycinamidine (FGAM) synthase-like amidotransferase family enzyme
MDDRQELINRIAKLYVEHNRKVAEWQRVNGYPEEVGCLTREACEIVGLVPHEQEHGITIAEITAVVVTLSTPGAI